MARRGLTTWFVALAALIAWPAARAGAQSPRDCDTDAPATRPEHGGRRGPGEGWRGRPGPPGAWQVEHLTRRFFMVLPEDRGPLRDGEMEDLLAFAREQMPHVYRAMERARSRDPELFRRKFEEHAPQLRHMKRVFEESPEIGQLLKQHAQNEFQIRRELRRLRHSPEDSALYADALRDVRALVAENVRGEIRTLTLLKEKFADRMVERVDARLAYLLSDNADLTDEPESVREAVVAYQAAPPEERDAARQRLEQMAQHRVQGELQAINERLEMLKSQAPEEVDRRVQFLLERAERMDRPDAERGPRPGPGRGPGRRSHAGRSGESQID